ncbi:MAG: SCO family protein [Paludisphaera borealis]|uniref:SCO family protein n=1 Tax=Paludisphaera borealis TaxID=1387353 RepID=UPI0028486ABF|nr:SCO family protein [Paludisphaera borealis]MDR3622683.1 SCO family protein [Paludisphaera borealis]
MTKPTIVFFRAVVLVVVATAVASASRAESQQFATTASQVGFDQRLGEQVPLDLVFRDEAGVEAPLGSYFGRRPVVLALVFHRCPLLCNQVLTGLTRSLKPLPLGAGVDFDVVAVSIDPGDTPEVAGRKKAGYLERYDRPGSEAGWHFLTGRKEAIDALCQAVGFKYVYDPQKQLFAHAAGVVVLTPGGQAAQYFYGIEYPSKELDGAIRRAASGRIGSRIAKLLLLCYDYDAATGKYTLSIVRLLRVFGTLTALSLGVYLFMMFRRERFGRLGDEPRPEGAATTAVPGPGL